MTPPTTDNSSIASAQPGKHPLAESIAELQRRVLKLEKQQLTTSVSDPNRMNLLVFESHRDRLLAAFVMATGAAEPSRNPRNTAALPPSPIASTTR